MSELERIQILRSISTLIQFMDEHLFKNNIYDAATLVGVFRVGPEDANIKKALDLITTHEELISFIQSEPACYDQPLPSLMVKRLLQILNDAGQAVVSDAVADSLTEDNLEALNGLEPENFYILSQLIQFIRKLLQAEEITKMGIDNFAQLISIPLFSTYGTDVFELAGKYDHNKNLLHSIIGSKIFQDEPDVFDFDSVIDSLMEETEEEEFHSFEVVETIKDIKYYALQEVLPEDSSEIIRNICLLDLEQALAEETLYKAIWLKLRLNSLERTYPELLETQEFLTLKEELNQKLCEHFECAPEELDKVLSRQTLSLEQILTKTISKKIRNIYFWELNGAVSTSEETIYRATFLKLYLGSLKQRCSELSEIEEFNSIYNGLNEKLFFHFGCDSDEKALAECISKKYWENANGEFMAFDLKEGGFIPTFQKGKIRNKEGELLITTQDKKGCPFTLTTNGQFYLRKFSANYDISTKGFSVTAGKMKIKAGEILEISINIIDDFYDRYLSLTLLLEILEEHGLSLNETQINFLFPEGETMRVSANLLLSLSKMIPLGNSENIFHVLENINYQEILCRLKTFIEEYEFKPFTAAFFDDMDDIPAGGAKRMLEKIELAEDPNNLIESKKTLERILSDGNNRYLNKKLVRSGETEDFYRLFYNRTILSLIAKDIINEMIKKDDIGAIPVR